MSFKVFTELDQLAEVVSPSIYATSAYGDRGVAEYDTLKEFFDRTYDYRRGRIWAFTPVIYNSIPVYIARVMDISLISSRFPSGSTLEFITNKPNVNVYAATVNYSYNTSYQTTTGYTHVISKETVKFGSGYPEHIIYDNVDYYGNPTPTNLSYINATLDNTRDFIFFFDFYYEGVRENLSIIIDGIEYHDYHYTSISWLQRADLTSKVYSHFGLSMVADDHIKMGQAITTTDASFFNKLFPPSSIQTIIKSMAIGDEKVLCYVGNHIANSDLLTRTLAMKYESLDPDDNGVTVSFRFYVDRAEVTDLRLTVTYFKTAENIMNQYLAMYVDEAMGVARPTIIKSTLGFYYYNQESISFETQQEYFTWLAGGYLITDPTIENPFYWGNSSESSGGNTGTFDDESDNITGAVTPNSNLIPSNFITIYTPTVNDMQNLSNALWDETAVAWLKRRWADPVEAIISLKFIPYAIGSAYKTSKSVTIGGHSTGLTFPMVTQQFFILHCGEIDLKGYYGSYLDYAPLTKVQLYLPYIDTVELDADVVMNHILRLSYNIDIVSGVCTAVLRVDGEVRYQFSGNLSYSIPLTSGDYSTYFTALIGGASKAISSVFLGAALGIPSMGATAGLSSAANAVSNSKATVSVSGSLGSTNGFMSLQTPYLIITTPTQCVAANQSKYMGYPLHTERKLSDLTGYTEIEEIHLENLSCTEGERAEIETLLKGGVIF